MAQSHTVRKNSIRTADSKYRNLAVKEGNNFPLFSLVGAFIVCLVLRDIQGIAVSKYVFILLACGVFALTDIRGMVAFLAFITPISLGVSYTFITILAVVFLVLKLMLAPGEKINLGMAVLFPFVIVFIEILNSFFSVSDTIPEFVRSVVMVVLFALLFLDKHKQIDARLSLYMYLLGYLVLVVFTLFWVDRTGSVQEFFLTGTTLKFGLVSEFEGNKVFAASFAMGSYSLIAISTSLLLFYSKQGPRILLLVMAVFSFVMGFVSTSRSFVFSAILCVFLYILFSAKSSKSVVRVLAVTVVLSAIVLILINTVLSEAYLTFVEKMSMGDISNGRFELFRYYNEIFLRSPRNFLIGVGLQDYIAKTGSYWNAIHNAVQEVLVTWGVIGLVCVCGLFSAMYKNALRDVPKEDRKLIFAVPAIVYLFFVQFNQLFSVRSYTIIILVVYCALALNSQIFLESKEQDP